MSDAFSATRTSFRIRTEAEVLEAEASLEGLEAAVAWRSWRRPTWKGRHGGPGGGSSSSEKGLEAANLESLETAEVLEATAGLEVEANLEVLESVGLEVLESADCGDHPGGGVHLAAAGLAVAKGLEAVANLEATAGLELVCLEAAILEVLEAAILEGLEAVVGTNLEGLEAVVGTNLEVPAVTSTWRRPARRWRPGGPGGGVLEGPEAASWRPRMRRLLIQ
ncbi:unnamed protein product [Arctogadus glacialis]